MRAAKDDAKPSDVRPAISEKKLKQLLSSCRSGTKDLASITGELREKIGYAKEHDHLHTGAFGLVRRLDRLEPEKLADFLDSMDHYLDISGLRDRAETAPRIDFNADKRGEEAETDQPADGGRKKRRGGDDIGKAAVNAAADRAEARSRRTNGANVKPFPSPTTVPAE